MKKGFTIIEVIVAMGIGITILLIDINMLSTQAIKYKKFIKADREESYCREALRFIEGEVYALDNKSVKVNEDTLIIKKLNGDENIIKALKNYNGKFKIVITYNKVKNISKVTDTIIEDVAAFKITLKENLIFISINTLEGENYERCFGIGKKEDIL